MNKAKIYASFGITYSKGKIYHESFGWISPLLIDGNSKLGKGVWTFSTLAGNILWEVEINGQKYIVPGTCSCNCRGCYAQTGFFRMPSVVKANAIKTILCRKDLDFVIRAIKAQIIADGVKLLRIHASGDFFSPEYIEAWREIVKASPETLFWTYTKSKEAEEAFYGLENANIVKSIIPGYGFNFGKCGYILRVYRELRKLGKNVYICRCGIDKNQHCTNCKGCAKK